MSEPYRQSPSQLCPRCSASALREHEQQLVCDACHATLLPIAALTTSLTEIDGSADVIEVRDLAPDPVICPRCSQTMQMCSLQRGNHMVPGRFHYCTRDGVCVPRDVLVAGYARATRVARSGMSPGARSGAGNAYMNLGPGNATAFRAVRDAFAPASPAIGHYELPRPLVHTLFVSAFRGLTLHCPTCHDSLLQFAGDRWACTKCAGTLVEDAALVAMISDIVHKAWEMPAAGGKPGERKCPVCAKAMTTETFETVTVDRCLPHGTWFDDQELQTALLHAGDPPSHLVGWLKKLFHRA
jgi:ribosomal protein S27AE